MDSTGSFLDTSFVENLTLSVMPCDSPNDVMENGSATAFSFESISLICDFIGLTDATRKALQTSQYSVERPLTQLNYSYFQEQFVSEKVAAAGSAGEYTKSIDIDCRPAAL